MTEDESSFCHNISDITTFLFLFLCRIKILSGISPREEIEEIAPLTIRVTTTPESDASTNLFAILSSVRLLHLMIIDPIIFDPQLMIISIRRLRKQRKGIKLLLSLSVIVSDVNRLKNLVRSYPVSISAVK